MPRFTFLSSCVIAIALLFAPRVARADVAPPATSPSPVACRGAIQHPIDVRVEALDAVRRGQVVRVRLTASSSRTLERAQVRLIHLGGATQVGPERVPIGLLKRDTAAQAEFRVVVPRVGRRALLQFVVTGDDDGVRLGRGATLNLLPDGPQRPLRAATGGDGDAMRVYSAEDRPMIGALQGLARRAIARNEGRTIDAITRAVVRPTPLAIACAALAVAALSAAPALAYTVSGRFLYEDRLWDRNGYTGAVQNLPVRHAKVEVTDGAGVVVLATTATGTDGRFSVAVTLDAPLIAVRVVTDGRPAGYQMRVVDNFVRVPTVGLVLTASQLYAVTTDPQTHLPGANANVGEWLLQDEDGTGVAQAFNIFDNGIDFFDYIASPQVLGALPAAEQFLVYAWDPQSNPTNPPPLFGSNYSQQGIFIGTNPDPTASDTDGWSDTVILHETGHWYDDMYSRSDNPGGGHTLPDNSQDPRLSYGEGSATYHCAKVREFRASRPNLSGQPIDNHISTYADLLVPPDVGTPGALSFSYDFETGVMYFPDANGVVTSMDIGQRGSACETNVTSALWDLLDGPATRDETPGVDDDALEVNDQIAWDIEHVYLTSMPATNALTVEDYVQGWYARNGASFHRPELDQIFVTLARMPFASDALEPDNGIAGAHVVTPVAYTAAVGHLAINELDLGPYDAVEVYNGTLAAQDLTGWQIEVYVNGTTNDPTRVFTFPLFTLRPGEVVVVHEGGDPTANGQVHLYGGSTPAANVFNISWNYDLDGAVVLRRLDGTPVDFVRWSDANGVDNTTPVPAGTAFSGVLAPPQNAQTLQRNVNGSDADAAADFVAAPSLLGYVNHPSPVPHTLFDVGDQDVVSFQAQAGNRYGFETRGPFSDTDTRIELLGPDGNVLGANDDVETGFRDSRVDFYAAQAGTYYVRVTNVSAYNDYGEFDLMAFRRPVANVLATPSALEAAARNASDVNDPVAIRFLPAGAYDSSAVFRDGTRIATLGRGVTEYLDHANRGVHTYQVSGFVGGAESDKASDWEFAGDVTCHGEDDFESGNANLWVKDLGTWNVTATHASQGVFSLTDSPAGLYRGCEGVLESCFLNTIATFGVPTDLPPGSTLEFDHICITEATFDFGIVEISVNDGASWIELRRYDESSYPEWADLIANPGDWKNETFDLSAYAYKRLLLRFRLYSDSNLEHDGWYVDAVHVNLPGCTEVPLDVPGPQASAVLRFLPPSPNPMRALARFVFTLPERQDRVDVAIHDVSGRLVRYERLGVREPGSHTWTWNGRDGEGRVAATGVYFVRLLAGKRALTQKVLKVGG